MWREWRLCISILYCFERDVVRNIENIIIENDDLGLIPKRSFYGLYSLKKVDLNKIFYISAGAFCGRRLLNDIDLKSVRSIGQSAFENCIALKTIDLSKVTEIGENAFKGCTGLATVTLPTDAGKAKKFKEAICYQTWKKPGDGIKPRTINFINDPDPAE